MSESRWSEFDKAARQFLDVLRRSGLVEDSKLDDVLLNLDPQKQPDSRTLSFLTRILIERCLLTRWQVDKLSQQKFKGFILDDYVLTDHIDSSPEFMRYRAYNRTDNRQVFIKVPPTPKRRYLSNGQFEYEVEEVE